jgi:hypothetical protein
MTMARFDSVMGAQQVDPQLRMRMMLSAMAAVALTTFAGAASWTAEHLKINRVEAPQLQYALLLDVSPITPPPAASPPPRPATAAAAATEVPEEDDPTPRDDDPMDVDVELEPVRAPKAVPGARTVPGTGGPTGTGPIGGPSHCLVPPCVGTTPLGIGIGSPPPIRRPPPKVDDTVMAKISAVRANAVYSPDPDANRLARTAAGTVHRRPGKSAVQFCVSPQGKAVEVRTASKFGDAEVDRICRETVSSWRFRPFTVDGTARKTCSTVTFEIRFD